MQITSIARGYSQVNNTKALPQSGMQSVSFEGRVESLIKLKDECIKADDAANTLVNSITKCLEQGREVSKAEMERLDSLLSNAAAKKAQYLKILKG